MGLRPVRGWRGHLNTYLHIQKHKIPTLATCLQPGHHPSCPGCHPGYAPTLTMVQPGPHRITLAPGWWHNGYVPQRLQSHTNSMCRPLDQHYFPGLHPWPTGCHHCWHCTSHGTANSLSEHGYMGKNIYIQLYIAGLPSPLTNHHLY